MTKILLTGFPTMGGSGMIATRLGIELADRGYDVHFLFYKRPFFLKDSDSKDNITFHEVDQPDYALFKDIGSPFTIQSAAALTKIIRDEKIDILHSHYAIPHAVSSYLASQIVPVITIVTTHGSDAHSLGKKPGYNEPISLALKNANAVTSVSKFLARETESVFNLEIGSVPVVYDFVDTDLFKPLDVKRDLCITQASNFRKVKQIPLLIEYFAEVVPNFPNWKLTLIGDGPEVIYSLRKARALKIKSRVNFMGVQKNIPEIFANASIMASTSTVESFGLTIAEAMSCETPIWAPRRGGIPELCIDGETGFLYDFDDKQDAVDKLAKLMESEELRIKMGKNARKRILDNFSVNKIVNDYISMYKKLLNTRIDIVHTTN